MTSGRTTPRPTYQEARQERIARRIDRPECGFWAVREASGGPEVGARIFLAHTTFEPGEPSNLMVRSPFLAAEINGRVVDVEDVWTRRGRIIDEDFFWWLIEHRRWARRYRPASPEANTRSRVNLRGIDPILPPPGRR